MSGVTRSPETASAQSLTVGGRHQAQAGEGDAERKKPALVTNATRANITNSKMKPGLIIPNATVIGTASTSTARPQISRAIRNSGATSRTHSSVPQARITSSRTVGASSPACVAPHHVNTPVNTATPCPDTHPGFG